MNVLLRFVLILLALIAIPSVATIAGTIYYGWLGGLAGLGIGMLIVKMLGRFAKRRFNTRMAKDSKVMESAKVSIIKISDAPSGKFLDGDEDLRKFHPRSFYLDLEVNPNNELEWDMAGIHIMPEYDEDLLDDDTDPDSFGYGLYTFAIDLVDGESLRSVVSEKVIGPRRFRFFFGAGERVERVEVKYYFGELTHIDLIHQ